MDYEFDTVLEIVDPRGLRETGINGGMRSAGAPTGRPAVVRAGRCRLLLSARSAGGRFIAVSHTAKMMPGDETRGPLFTGRGLRRVWMVSWFEQAPTGQRSLEGVMLQRRPFGPGVRMVSCATEPLWGRNLAGIWFLKPRWGRSSVGVRFRARPVGPRSLVGSGFGRAR